MSLNTQPYKGTRDFYPEDKRIQKYMFGKIREVVEGFGYQEYDAPILEPFELYAAKSGDELVNEQLYSFEDKGGRKMAIRPEMTPSVSRMVAGRRQELAYPLRWYSIPNLWRYERPQKGRLREHWQLNVDLFGIEGVEADHEVILVADRILKSLGAKPEYYRININSRAAMVAAMKDFGLEEAELKRAYQLVDKMPKLSEEDFKQVLVEALGAEKSAKLLDYLQNGQPPENIKKLLKLLKESGVTNAIYDRSVVRGLDYYTDIVFEVFATHPDLARAMYGGGRYDGLVQLFGVDALPVAGFGMGDVMVLEFLKTHDLLPNLEVETDAVAILIGDVYEPAQKVLDQLRAKGAKLAVDFSGRKLDAQIKSAVKSGTRYALFIGEEELKTGNYKLRDLEKGEELSLPLDQVASKLSVRP